jgi:hypothetical protein
VVHSFALPCVAHVKAHMSKRTDAGFASQFDCVNRPS